MSKKFELKNLKSFLSTDGYGFTATLYVDNIKTAIVHDAAQGGELMYLKVFDDVKLKEVNEYVKTLPKIVIDGYTIEQDMHIFIDSLVEASMKKKHNSKLDREIKKKVITAIVIQHETGFRYYDFRKPLTSLPKTFLQEYIDNKVRPKLKEGETIFNDLVAIGLK